MPIQIISAGPFTCINCGAGKYDSVYRVYGCKKAPVNQIPAQVTHLTLTECSNCGEPVDNYIELDNSILCLDAILQKTTFFRHCLLNCQLTFLTTLKLFILFTLCDSLYIMNQVTRHASWSNGNLNYFWFEMIFYSSVLVSFVECLLNYLTTILLFNSLTYITRCGHINKSPHHVIKCLIFSSYYKLFNVILALWTSEFQNAVHHIVILLQVTSLAQCMKVISSYERPVIASLLAFVIALSSRSMSQHLLLFLWNYSMQFLTDNPLGHQLSSHVIPSLRDSSLFESLSNSIDLIGSSFVRGQPSVHK